MYKVGHLMLGSQEQDGHSDLFPPQCSQSPPTPPTLSPLHDTLGCPASFILPTHTTEAIIGWPHLHDVFGAPSTTVIGDLKLPKPAHIPATRLGGAKANERDPTVSANWCK